MRLIKILSSHKKIGVGYIIRRIKLKHVTSNEYMLYRLHWLEENETIRWRIKQIKNFSFTEKECGTCYTFRVIFLIISSLKYGSCRNGAIPSADPPAFLALRGTACNMANGSEVSQYTIRINSLIPGSYNSNFLKDELPILYLNNAL